MHTYNILRPGQVRGVLWLAPVMLALCDLDDYRDAERMRKKTEACLAGIVTRLEGSGGVPIGAKSTDPKTGNTLERMYSAIWPSLVLTGAYACCWPNSVGSMCL